MNRPIEKFQFRLEIKTEKELLQQLKCLNLLLMQVIEKKIYPKSKIILNCTIIG